MTRSRHRFISTDISSKPYPSVAAIVSPKVFSTVSLLKLYTGIVSNLVIDENIIVD